MALDGLPDVYRSALELRAAQLDDAEIAHALGVDEAAIPNLLRLAEAKAARARVHAAEGDDRAHID